MLKAEDYGTTARQFVCSTLRPSTRRAARQCTLQGWATYSSCEWNGELIAMLSAWACSVVLAFDFKSWPAHELCEPIADS
jgi:hypothetical protein